MNPVSRAPVYCTACQAFGVVANGGGVCSVCEGAGEFPRLVDPDKIVAAVDLSPVPDMSFRRMAVLLTEHSADGRVVLRGVTDGGSAWSPRCPPRDSRRSPRSSSWSSSVGWSS